MSNKLFQDLDLNHKPHRNGYDLGKKVAFTSKSGELLPVLHRTMMPGDTANISFDMFSRSRPTISKPYTQIREYIDVFFVPYRLLWKGAQAMQTNNKKNPDIASNAYTNRQVGDYAPRYDSYLYRKTNYSGEESYGVLANLSKRKNQFGFNRGVLSAKLNNHFQYGYLTIDDIKNYVDDLGNPDPLVTPQYLSLYPWLAYQCIYYKFYRNSQWEDNQPYNYNVDYLDPLAIFSVDPGTNPNNYWDNPTIFDLRYSNYPRDLFFGIFPDAQLGDEAVVDVDLMSDSTVNTIPLQSLGGPGANGFIGVSSTPLEPTSNGVFGIKPIQMPGASAPESAGKPLGINASSITQMLDSLQGKFGILELRKAQFEQRYREILGSGQNEYRTIIRKIFGIEVPDTIANIPYYLGGHTNEINFQEVTNTNLTDGNLAKVGSKGLGGSNSDVINFEAQEHGILMAIYHNQPVIDYALNALHFDSVKTEFDDFANPVFDQLGFQELPSYFLDCSRKLRTNKDNVVISLISETLGYTNRYFDYKTDVDTILGDFRETQKYWFAPVGFDYLKEYISTTASGSFFDINYNFFKVNPRILDPIFSVPCGDYVDTDQIETTINIKFNAVRPLDYHGVPY